MESGIQQDTPPCYTSMIYVSKANWEQSVSTPSLWLALVGIFELQIDTEHKLWSVSVGSEIAIKIGKSDSSDPETLKIEAEKYFANKLRLVADTMDGSSLLEHPSNCDLCERDNGPLNWDSESASMVCAWCTVKLRHQRGEPI